MISDNHFRASVDQGLRGSHKNYSKDMKADILNEQDDLYRF